jgi:hypothetical protein
MTCARPSGSGPRSTPRATRPQSRRPPSDGAAAVEAGAWLQAGLAGWPGSLQLALEGGRTERRGHASLLHHCRRGQRGDSRCMNAPHLFSLLGRSDSIPAAPHQLVIQQIISWPRQRGIIPDHHVILQSRARRATALKYAGPALAMFLRHSTDGCFAA